MVSLVTLNQTFNKTVKVFSCQSSLNDKTLDNNSTFLREDRFNSNLSSKIAIDCSITKGELDRNIQAFGHVRVDPKSARDKIFNLDRVILKCSLIHESLKSDAGDSSLTKTIGQFTSRRKPSEKRRTYFGLLSNVSR